MNGKGKSIIFIIVGIFVILLILNANDVFGLPAGRLEQDARMSQKIDPAWEVSKAIDDKIGALLFYNEQMDNHVFSIYLNRPGFSYGYFFYSGGGIGEIMDGVAEFTYAENKGSALLSMNKLKISKIEFGNEKIDPIEVDPSKPFAVIIPENCYSFTMYDRNGKEIPVDNIIIR